MELSASYIKGMEYLVEVVQKLSLCQSMEEVAAITRHAARELTGADGATFVLKDGDLCYYFDEDAISPLWKGKRFPMETCISGWAMLNKQTAVIEDIYQDPRIPHDAYRPTFVKSLAMIPIRDAQPIGAIGNYWAKNHKATPEQLKLLKALADSTSVALENVQLITSLKEANSALEKSLVARDEFLSIASHELRTPLSVLRLQIQMTNKKVLNQTPETADMKYLRSSSEVAKRQVDNLIYLVEQLLDISKIRLEKVELNYTMFDLSKTIRNLLEEFEPKLAGANCHIDLNADENILGEWDQIRILQVLTNLISNIVRHAPNSKATISLKKHGSSVALTIADKGPGISEEAQKRLFHRFERGDSSKNLGGLGLGLFISKSLVEAHQGSIQLQSVLNQGTTFSIELPLKPGTLRVVTPIESAVV